MSSLDGSRLWTPPPIGRRALPEGAQGNEPCIRAGSERGLRETAVDNCLDASNLLTETRTSTTADGLQGMGGQLVDLQEDGEQVEKERDKPTTDRRTDQGGGYPRKAAAGSPSLAAPGQCPPPRQTSKHGNDGCLVDDAAAIWQQFGAELDTMLSTLQNSELRGKTRPDCHAEIGKGGALAPGRDEPETTSSLLARVPGQVLALHTRMRPFSTPIDPVIGSLPEGLCVLSAAKRFLIAASKGAALVNEADFQAAPSSGKRRRERVLWEKRANARRLECVLECLEIVPNIAVLCSILLQGAVQSNTAKAVVQLVSRNGKSLETDRRPLVQSLRMLKAANNNLLILVAPGLPAQVVWAETPLPYRNFAELVAAAGGTLENIVPSHHLTSPDEAGYLQFLRARAADVASKDKQDWQRVRSEAASFGLTTPSLPPTSRDKEPTDRSANAGMQRVLGDLSAAERAGAATWSYSGHGITALYPWPLHCWDAHSAEQAEPTSKRLRRKQLLLTGYSRIQTVADKVRSLWGQLQLGHLLPAPLQISGASGSEQDLLEREREAPSKRPRNAAVGNPAPPSKQGRPSDD
jgi:hypothetical protein